jgi:pimeloyl-ACP methyl ester carboxylesterase
MRTSHVLPILLLAGALSPAAKLCAQTVGIAKAGVRTSPVGKLIVIGFMGGNVSADNLLHREALVAQELQQRYPAGVEATVFANHDGQSALRTVLHLLDANGDGRLTAGEKSAARIVIYGHSWGASETVTLARRLNELGVPVLLTIQVDSVEKSREDDRNIPPNVREAVNFYQTRGLWHGRSLIAAMDPSQTTILGNYESSYRQNSISCAGFPWLARTFMRTHIEIENDPSVWTRIEALIRAEVH